MTPQASTAARERPILFKAPLVRAILAGKKSVTRRVVKPQPPSWIESFGYSCFTPPGSISGRGNFEDRGPAETFFRCPYGVPGDLLYVKETWAKREDIDPATERSRAVHYLLHRATYEGDIGDEWHYYGRWRPSIFMPRWASRITLRVTDVRVERLRDITEEEAITEGFYAWTHRTEGEISARHQFRELWAEINGKRSGCAWEDSPWVWVIQFRKEG